jgi:hypothetical protein
MIRDDWLQWQTTRQRRSVDMNLFPAKARASLSKRENKRPDARRAWDEPSGSAKSYESVF